MSLATSAGVTLTVAFSDGDASPKSVSIPITNDTVDEPDERLTLTLSSPTNGLSLGTQTTASLTIIDDDPGVFRLGGRVAGLARGGSVVVESSSERLTLLQEGTFQFTTPVVEGTAFSVIVATQPVFPQQICTVVGGSGVMGPRDVLDIAINCVTPPQPVVYHSRVNGQNDLLLVNDDGTGEVLLAKTPHEERFLTFSPSGRVVFARAIGRNFDLFSIRPDGTDEIALAATADNEEPDAMTTDGMLIYTVSAGGSSTLYAVPADGGGTPIPLSGHLTEDAFFTAVAPDGRVIFETDDGSGNGNLYSIRADGTGRAVLANSADSESYAGVLRDGRIVISIDAPTGSDLFAINTDGTNRIPIGVTTAYESFLAATPDGKAIISRDINAGDLFAVSTDGSGAEVTLATTPAYEQYVGLTASGRIVIAREANSQFDLLAVSANGNDPPIVLAGSSENEKFVGATRGGRVLFTRGDTFPIPLLSVRDDGTDERVIAESGTSVLIDREVLSPDEHIPFATDATGRDLFSVHSDGTGLATLANSPDSEEFQGFTASGRIIYARPVNGQYDLFSVQRDGTDPRVLADSVHDEGLLVR